MTYRYPSDIESCSDFVFFEFFKYQTPIAGASGSGSNVAINYTTDFSKLTRSSIPSVYLNMPSDIGSSFTGGWGGKDTTSLAQFGLKTIATPVSKALASGDLGGATQGIFTDLTNKDTYKSLGKALGDDVLKALANGFNRIQGIGSNLSASDILQLTNNQILNPNTELLYGGPQLREHGYNFKLIPRSSSEADQVIGIVDSFKKAALPDADGAIFGSKGNNFISIPDLCKVTFKTRGSSGGLVENDHLPKYKVSGIRSVSKNYITDNGYMSYSDGKPLGISLTITLMETKLVFRQDLVDNKAR